MRPSTASATHAGHANSDPFLEGTILSCPRARAPARTRDSLPAYLSGDPVTSALACSACVSGEKVVFEKHRREQDDCGGGRGANYTAAGRRLPICDKTSERRACGGMNLAGAIIKAGGAQMRFGVK